MTDLPDPSEFVHPRDVRESLANLFPSENSFKWFLRQHRRDLAAAAAIIIVGERLLLHPKRFSAYVLNDGLERAGAVREAA